MEAEPPLVLRLNRAPGAREARVAHLLAGPLAAEAPMAAVAPLVRTARMDELEAEVASLRAELTALRESFEAFRSQF
jgi:uncharacterized protein YceH (UPF0502 family)